MAMTIREAFERGTKTFNAHDVDGFTGVLADDVTYRAPGGISGQGKAACAQFFAGWWGAFSGKHVSFGLINDRLEMLEQLGLIPALLPQS